MRRDCIGVYLAIIAATRSPPGPGGEIVEVLGNDPAEQ
jgi:hypothetical protein